MRVSCALKACQSTLERPPTAEECNRVLRVFSDYNIIGYIVYIFNHKLALKHRIPT